MTERGKIVLAGLLWLALAFIVWNAVFDRVLVLAGRRYIREATLSAHTGRGYLPIDGAMRPAIAHGLRVASIVGLSIAAVGLTAVVVAARLDRRRRARSPKPEA